jgi:hypothetical protein
MSSYVPAALKRLVRERAGGICEYCLIDEADLYFGCEIEHIIAEKHGGQTVESNLAMACAFCNQSKGSDIATLRPSTRDLCRLFNPRLDSWSDHFRIDGARIIGLTEIGEATVFLLQINQKDRLDEREALLDLGRYPSPNARRRIGRND